MFIRGAKCSKKQGSKQDRSMNCPGSSPAFDMAQQEALIQIAHTGRTAIPCDLASANALRL